MASTAQLNQLSFVRSDGVAEGLAAFLWDAAHGRLSDDRSAAGSVARRMAIKAARELLELHDIKIDEVLLNEHQLANNGSIAGLPTYATES